MEALLRVAVTGIVCTVTVGTVSGVLATTGGETTGVEALVMAASALVSIAVFLTVTRKACAALQG